MEKGRDIVSEKVEMFVKQYAKKYVERIRLDTELQSIKNIMKNCSFTLDQVFSILEISDVDRAIIIKALQEDKNSNTLE